MRKSKTTRSRVTTSQVIEQAIFGAWFDNASGLIRPPSIDAKDTGELFQAILSELTANVTSTDTDQDVCSFDVARRT